MKLRSPRQAKRTERKLGARDSSVSWTRETLFGSSARGQECLQQGQFFLEAGFSLGSQRSSLLGHVAALQAFQ